MEPEDINPQYDDAYKSVQRQRAEYEAALAAAPVREKPNLWRKLAAIGIGAFGGSQYDKGGLQWGQQLGHEVLEGPYQRKMNEHLKMLAAKRQGLDVAQEGVQVMGQIEARKQQAAQRALDAEDRKRNNEARLDADRQKQAQVYDAVISKQTGGEAIRYPSLDALNSDPDAQAKIKSGSHVMRQPSGTNLVYLTPTKETLTKREIENVAPLVTQINTLLRANPDIVRKGFEPVDMQSATTKRAQDLVEYRKEIIRQIENRDNNSARAARAGNRGGGNDDAKEYARAEKFKQQETDKINAQFAALKASKENQYQRQIAYARANGNKDEAERLEMQRGQELVEALNNAHLQIANIWGHKKFKQYALKDGKAVEMVVGGENTETPKPQAQPKQNDPLGVL